VVDVSGFHDSFGSIEDIPFGTCITAIDFDGETIIASFPQSLYFGNSMETSLIPPSQLWDHGVTVDVVPNNIVMVNNCMVFIIQTTMFLYPFIYMVAYHILLHGYQPITKCVAADGFNLLRRLSGNNIRTISWKLNAPQITITDTLN
jgi:hypothetical protein